MHPLAHQGLWFSANNCLGYCTNLLSVKKLGVHINFDQKLCVTFLEQETTAGLQILKVVYLWRRTWGTGAQNLAISQQYTLAAQKADCTLGCIKRSATSRLR